LEGVPVLVLSNNDGCAIARSEEVKALGVRMGEPGLQDSAADREARRAGLFQQLRPLRRHEPARERCSEPI
jgi:nucleotidyltransferase/DNA polymerase involved in DNA repair